MTEFYAGALIPGMVNAHSHLELAYLKGMITPHGGFAAFAQGLRAVRNKFSDQERERAIRAADSSMWQQGVQAVGDISNSQFSMHIKESSQIAYHTFAELYGLRTESIAHLEELLAHPHTSLTPHSIYSLGDRLFRRACEEGSGPLSIHFLESQAEKQLYHKEGELWRWYQRDDMECDFLHYGSPARRIVESVPKEQSTILVHNCCLEQSDIDTIMEHFTAPVYWCICPRSNWYISQSKPPIELLRQNSLNICVGTDSLSSNWSLTMLDEIRSVEGVSLQERLDWLCRVGAEAIGMGDSLGKVESGKRPGLILLEGLDLRRMELTDHTISRRLI